ncbi:3-dehydroquinate synthase [Hufsiella ginkgonis]|uniref:3-dehydroquinate synthase n=1 Tax=Hufsiella ginkgonis TaxID=2695274 RepID=A0A7K1Y387_9SPHI|nr:3-dehydroquinate synthase [Hufsiella ginkgonis]MXV17763.1 3-dehydroquinate synthase [Hufsiella ginkgonis]
MQPIKSNGYSVYFDDHFGELKTFLAEGSYSRVFFIADRNTYEKCLPAVLAELPDLQQYDVIEVDPGEENKNIDFCIGIWQMLLDFGADRNSLVINVGGGVVTDMGGFAASTFKRGIDFVQVPTTLLSQVDASVGGKTGVDFGGVKNIIGTFTQPKAVFISTALLGTLDRRQVISGFAEVIKHGLIRDKAYFEKAIEAAYRPVDTALIYRSVEIKNEVVTTDPFEKGLRKILNFGHTIGHAIESYSMLPGNSPLLHGEAIGFGMICESYLSHIHHQLTGEELNTIIAGLLRIYPYYPIEATAYPELIAIMLNDKKNTNGKIGFALLSAIGNCAYNLYVSEREIVDALEFYRELR